MAATAPSQRTGTRVQCGDRCILKHDGKCYDCLLMNISLSGALVTCDAVAPFIRKGDTCHIHLCGDIKACPSEISCRVTRLENAKIGLRFR